MCIFVDQIADMKTQILTHEQVLKMIRRMAYQIYEQHSGLKKLIIASINGKGQVLGMQLAEELRSISNLKIIEVQIELNKTRLDEITLVHNEKQLNLSNEHILLVDDVLNTGRTMMFSLMPFVDAKVAQVKVCVLVDRDHKQFPISADIIGMSLSTTLQEHVVVDYSKAGKFEVYLK